MSSVLDVYYIETTIDGEPYTYLALRVPGTNVVISYDKNMDDELDAYMVLPGYWECSEDWNVTYIGGF